MGYLATLVQSTCNWDEDSVSSEGWSRTPTTICLHLQTTCLWAIVHPLYILTSAEQDRQLQRRTQ